VDLARQRDNNVSRKIISLEASMGYLGKIGSSKIKEVFDVLDSIDIGGISVKDLLTGQLGVTELGIKPGSDVQVRLPKPVKVPPAPQSGAPKP
jgi:hypothetical protein